MHVHSVTEWIYSIAHEFECEYEWLCLTCSFPNVTNKNNQIKKKKDFNALNETLEYITTERLRFKALK